MGRYPSSAAQTADSAASPGITPRSKAPGPAVQTGQARRRPRLRGQRVPLAAGLAGGSLAVLFAAVIVLAGALQPSGAAGLS